MTIINKVQLKDHFEQFEPFEFKYKTIIEKYLNESIGEKRELWKRINEFQIYENAKQFSTLTKRTYDNFKENLNMIYRDNELTNLIIELFDMINEKIIRQYINIDGLERLFSEKYANFEWEMHLGMDHDEHSMTYYRDHFVHQIRDAYTMDMLLSNHGFLEKIVDILRNRGNSSISVYVCNMIDQQWFSRNIIFQDVDEKTLKGHFLRNTIYMSSYMAGLFHDIGYPVVTNMNENRKIIDYLAEMYMFMGGSYNFNRITSLLQNSLLFRVVSPREIRERIEGDKPDHGVVSALLFLLHFYENGAIYTLEPYKLCAVELAALAIYNHTNKYQALKQEKSNYERCLCTLNPISYLLRVADDLQEWGRIYFEVSKTSQIMLCEKCHMPVISMNKKEYGDKTKLVCERCGCVDGEQVALFAYDNFPRRKLYNVTVCKNLRIEGDFNNEEEKHHIYLDYRMDRLLQIALLSPNYAKHCIEELNHMKRLFVKQYKTGVVYVDYIITNNIILIKSRIVGEYYIKMDTQSQFSNCSKEMKCILNGSIIKEDVEKVYIFVRDYIEGNNAWFKKIYYGTSLKYIKKAVSLYLGIYLLTESVKGLNADREWEVDKTEDQIRSFMKFYGSFYRDFLDKEAENLLDDIVVQMNKLYMNLDKYVFYPDKYFYAFEYSKDEYGEEEAEKKNKKILKSVKKFCNVDRYSESVENDTQYDAINAFSDLYCIQQMILKIRECDESECEV